MSLSPVGSNFISKNYPEIRNLFEKVKIIQTLLANPDSSPYPEHCLLIRGLFQRLVQLNEATIANELLENAKNSKSWHPRKFFAASQGLLEELLKARLQKTE